MDASDGGGVTRLTANPFGRDYTPDWQALALPTDPPTPTPTATPVPPPCEPQNLAVDDAFVIDVDLNGSGDVVDRTWNGGTEAVASNNNPAVGERRIVIEADITPFSLTPDVRLWFQITQIAGPGAYRILAFPGDGVVSETDFSSSAQLVGVFGTSTLGRHAVDVSAVVQAATTNESQFLTFRVEAVPGAGSIAIATIDTSWPFEGPHLAAPDCLDLDADGVDERFDNCPDIFNHDQENVDADPFGDACELPGCETVPTAWDNPSGDEADCDGFPNSVPASGRGDESFIGTDPTDRCPDNSSDNAWPPDVNNNGWANLSDIVAFGPHFNTTSPESGYSPRFDLNASGAVNLSDIVMYGPFFNKSCTR